MNTKKRLNCLKLIRFIAFLTFLPSCVSLGTHNKATKSAYQKGYGDADKECIELQIKLRDFIKELGTDIQAKNERLSQFGQLNEDGTLKEPAPCYKMIADDCTKGLRGGDKPVDGTESWQK